MSGFLAGAASRTVLAAPFRAFPMIAALMIAAPAIADVAVVPAARDNTLIEDSGGALSDGAGPHARAGRTGQRFGSIRRAVIAFDVAAALPRGAIVTGAFLTLHMSDAGGGPARVNLHRVASDWGEGTSANPGGMGAPATRGDATWIHTFYDDRFWNTPGGDFSIANRASIILDQPGFYTWGPSESMTADVQSWLDDPDGDFGWILIGDERMERTVKRFDSRENPDPSLRPALTIEFTAPCPRPGGAPGAGFWHRQCLAAGSVDGGLDPSPKGRGPDRFSVPGFVDAILPCANDGLRDLGFRGVTACGVFGPRPLADCHPNAMRGLVAMLLNVCSGLMQSNCPANAGAGGCGGETIAGRIETLAALIRAGNCLDAIRCSGP